MCVIKMFFIKRVVAMPTAYISGSQKPVRELSMQILCNRLNLKDLFFITVYATALKYLSFVLASVSK